MHMSSAEFLYGGWLTVLDIGSEHIWVVFVFDTAVLDDSEV